ncbi:DUF3278 domain-containing protein [Lentibacillus sp. N15]|uniref:DUF3278 domain-containing protein n=1 Tax=Lentibacillus songyuanensis TaxID=3136161 RepID=UPI0031B9C70F
MRNKILKRFIGAIDDRDEYQLQEIHKELAFSGILLWGLTLILMFISLVIDTIHNTLTFITPALLIVNMVYAIKVVSKLRKKNLDDIDCATMEEYKEKKKGLKKSSTIAGVAWGITMLIFMQYIFPYLSVGEIDVSWWNVLIWAFAGVFFGIATYWLSRSKLRKHF